MFKTEWSYPVDIWNVGTMVSPKVHICQQILATLYKYG